ncbi:MAG: CapA family protein [Oscillospiraceae bacterium]|nr:CapA family protein [Oscillospiraceae bacterium]
MAKWIKKLKRIFRRHPWAKWAALGGAAALMGIVVLLLILGGHEPEKPPLGSSGNVRTITLVAGGDLNVTDNTVASGKVGETYDYTQNFLDVAEVFAGADAAFLNFEGTFSGESYGSATASAPLALAQTLSACGVDFLQTANSRSVSNGIWGLSQTLSAIRSCGMEPLGTYESNADFHQQQGFTLRTIGGIKVAFVAFTKGMDGMGLPSGSEKCVNLLYTDYTTTYKKINTQGITDILEAVEKAKPDITVALLHWGSEGNSAISPSQKKIANLMLSLGVDAIIGTHSHQVQSVVYDEENHSLIAYSLGDFYGDGTTSGSYYSMLLQMQITKDLDTGETAITGWDYIPIYTLTQQRDGQGMKVVRIDLAMELYENAHISSVSEATYENMKSALAQIEKRIQPPAE